MNMPKEVEEIISKFQAAGFEAYAVGGCVRDLLLGKKPADWDITTSATPEQIQKVFPKSFYANRFGTVTVLTAASDANMKEIEVTTYRVEADYTDSRHPNKVDFTASLEEDLARRDFTINAMAMKPGNMINGMDIIDLFGGLQDLNKKHIRAVGDPRERFSEDALRLLRAIRFASQLGFTIESATFTAIQELAATITRVSLERIRDELVKIVMSKQPESGFNMLNESGLLLHILPELAEGVGVEQNKHHIYTVFDHCIKSLQYAADFEYPLHVRLATLFHDIGKPRTRRLQGDDYTFYAHEIVGARMTEKLMQRLKFPNELITKVVHLVRQHMFYYDVGKVTEAGTRRLLRRVGKENFADLVKLRVAERKGSGVPKAHPYRLRHLEYMVEKVSQEPITTGDLAISGTNLIHELKLTPGPIFGGVLNALLAEVLEDPKKNTKEYLLRRAQELLQEDPDKLKALGAAAVEEEERKREEDIKRKFHL
jgi:poly(A) polymerase/tRNA nucleotidyltransferase (CCA-adding enzyme)